MLAEADEQHFSAVSGACSWVACAAAMVPIMFFPGVTHAHRPVLAEVAVVALGFALITLRLADRGPSSPLFHVSSGGAVTMIVVAVSASGGAGSPAWIYFLFPAIFCAYFYRVPWAAFYLTVCALAQGAPLLYDRRALHLSFPAQWLLAATAYVVLGAAILFAKRLLSLHRRRAERLAALQGALRRVATAAVSGEGDGEIYGLVAREVAALLGGGAAGILRLRPDGSSMVMGSWADRVGGSYPPGAIVPRRPGGDVELALAARRPVRIERHGPGSPVDRLGYASSIVAPVSVDGATWGILAVTAPEGRLTAEDEQRLMAFGDLLATAIASIEDRAKLAAQASSDPLTGLANHRTLHERLQALAVRACEQHENVAVVVLDIDHFKQINDIGGHELGDETLIRVADCLRALARPQDTLSRAGGDEFTWVMPGLSRELALDVVQRARALIEATVSKPYRVTVSAGICDTAVTGEASELLRLADGALYWSKAHGRDQCQIYDPAVVEELSAHERADRLERSHALVGLRALARAIDAKDPATREHSERVAALAGKLARMAGWSAERALLLSEAALVHDVGKIGVPDAVLRKPGWLSEHERMLINEHAELSARIVEGVLSAEQVEWIRHHHERPDGRGYPRGIDAAAIPEGSSLLAAADAFDVMTVGRRYSAPKSIAEALAECRALAGVHFSEVAVAALEALDEDGGLGVDIAGAVVMVGAPD